MDIVFNPPVNEENQYVQLLVRELRANGYRIHPLDTIFSSWRHFKSIGLVHLNWFEVIDDSSIWTALRSFFRKLVVLVAIRLSGKPLVWTMHNRAAHDSRLAFFSRFLTRRLVRWSDRIVIHTQQSTELLATYGRDIPQKTVYLPHPNFIKVYGEVRPAASAVDETLHLLFVGMVKPYKNLELLIETVSRFGTRVHLTLAGKAVDAQYRYKIEAMARDAHNVTLLSRFVQDDEMAALLSGADALVLPYDLASSLNSGTVILAFSYQRTVICPEIGTVADLGPLREAVFHYTYATETQHKDALAAQIQRALAMKRQEPGALRAMGEQLYGYVASAYDPALIGEELDKLYRTLTWREI